MTAATASNCGLTFAYILLVHTVTSQISYLIFLVKIRWSFSFRAYCRTVNITVNSPPSLPLRDYFPAPTQYARRTQKIKLIPACLRDSKGPVRLRHKRGRLAEQRRGRSQRGRSKAGEAARSPGWATPPSRPGRGEARRAFLGCF